LTDSEYKALLGYRTDLRVGERNPGTYLTLKDVPKSVDWRDSGAVTPIKD